LPAATPAERPPAVAILHRYGPHASQVAELHVPDGPGAHPVAVLLHGGFWRRWHGRGLMDRLAADLARRGVAAWNLEYRRTGPLGGGGWPETFLDVAAGVDALAGVAGLDLTRVATVGHSAGGHLALWAAARGRLPVGAPGAGPVVRPALAVSLAGVPDLAAAHRAGVGGGAVARLMGGGPDRVPERYAVGSPAELLPLGVPQRLVHGAADDIVPAELSRVHARRARAEGDACDLVVLPGVGHFEPIDPASRAWAAALGGLAAISRPGGP
jgi:acetyl esterase/lipase